MNKTSFTSLAVLIVIFAIIMSFYNPKKEAPQTGPIEPVPGTIDTNIPSRISVTGTWECLPHKDTKGPQTEECAFGIAADEGNTHYAVNFNLISTTLIDFPTGTKVRVEGLFVPLNQLSTNMWQRYPIEGIISATSVEKL